MGQGGGGEHLRGVQDTDGKEYHQADAGRLPKNQSKHTLFRGFNQPNQEQTPELHREDGKGTLVLES